MIRLFAAIAIPDTIAAGLAARQNDLPGARWRSRESLHITLKFAGEMAETVADDFATELATITAPALTLNLRGAGMFGEGVNVRAVWAGVEGSPGLEHLAESCEAAARRALVAPRSSLWRPHVTLAYLRRARPDRVGAWIQSHSLLTSPPFRIDAFGLYSSWPGRAASAYRLERSYALV